MNLLKTAEIDIYCSGKINEPAIAERYNIIFGKINRNYIDDREEKKYLISESLDDNSKDVFENQKVTQGKIVLGYNLKSENLKDDFYKMTVYSAILGGTASSKLFCNVREKKSLAYTISSQYIKHKGAMFVAAGIELENFEIAKESILKEINDMKIGEITDEEIHDAKVNLITRFKSFNDSQPALIGWAVGQEILDGDMDLDVVINKIDAITKEDVLDVANRLNLAITYYLKS